MIRIPGKNGCLQLVGARADWGQLSGRGIHLLTPLRQYPDSDGRATTGIRSPVPRGCVRGCSR